MSTLEEEINQKSKEIRTDSYPMSIGEIINMYNEEELDIHPEFQRFYRWSTIQKTRLIESILLHIPIPPIFVAQRKDGVWDVVDGLQRLSTILNFVGVLKNDNKELIEPLVLEKTELLPSLEAKEFGTATSEGDKYFTDTLRRYFKREKLSFTIIQKESDETSKYELFQRLNTGGSSLTDQEVRSCLIVMNDKEAFNHMREMANDDNFKECIQISDNNIIEQYDLELITRFLVLKNIEIDKLKGIIDFGAFLNTEILELIHKGIDWEKEYKIFQETFSLLLCTKGDCFKRYDSTKEKFSGGFLVSAFEIVALGIGYNIEQGHSISPEDIEKDIKEIWIETTINGPRWAGANAASRLLKTLPLGRKGFHHENKNN
ncbi:MULTISPECIES: DUF262 domain-containing protein [Butyricimonas]|uniref:DUF262 domain-containing protein n=1 Tax=Butyricimonas TaxID=574697 RepID=UPI0022E8BF50|nr:MULTISPECIES: DUF262 domain-containing protein [Butyricimonas]